ncbi:MAG: peptidoglycan-binding domain-containing protein [Acidimicrobiia bacterium]
MERADLNWRGVVIFGLAVLSVIVLINVIDDDPAQLGAPTVDAGVTTTTIPGQTTTTIPGQTTTTAKSATTTTVKGGTTTTTRSVPAAKPTLQAGSSGADVTALQQILISLGYLTGSADGQYGAATTAAVKAFQTNEGITATVPGAVDAATWARLQTTTKRAPGT